MPRFRRENSMARSFAQIPLTPDVQAVQARMGSRRAYHPMEIGAVEDSALGPVEIAFIAARDSFYQATVGSNGWPYVQHRGGPAGFLKVLDAHTLGYADFSGNRQYISVGNLAGDERVSLFLMDYPQQQRLKIWGRARVVEEEAEPKLLARLASPHYRARIERGVVITVEAFDWNCPKYITPRYTEAEIQTLWAKTDAAETASAPALEDEVLGQGALLLTITGMRQLTARVRAYELRAAEGAELPPVEAGAHLTLPVRLDDSRVVMRQYSLTQHPARRDVYEIAVQRDDAGRGGSRAIHNGWRLGLRLAVDAPVNHFPLHGDDRPAVLIAGGIGVTPIKAMAHALKARGASFSLHYAARTPADMAFRHHLADRFASESHFYFSDGLAAKRLDLNAVLRGAPSPAVFYVCGPPRLIEGALHAADALGIGPARIQCESFT